MSQQWDRVWIGANIATMVAGAAPYGKLDADALAVRGERIAWMGAASEARCMAAKRGVAVEECGGCWITPGVSSIATPLGLRG